MYKTFEKVSNEVTVKVEETVKYMPFDYNVFKSDKVTIDVENDNFNFIVLLNIENNKREYDLTKLNTPRKHQMIFNGSTANMRVR